MAEVTAIRDRLVLTLEEVKAYLRIPSSNTSHDATLQVIMTSAMDQADRYCQNNFGGGDIPSGVKLGVLQLIARAHENRALGLQITGLSGIGYANWGSGDLAQCLWSYRRLTGLGAGLD